MSPGTHKSLPHRSDIQTEQSLTPGLVQATAVNTTHAIFDPDIQVLVQLASCRNVNGQYEFDKLSLLKNVTGIPCQLKELKTMQDATRIYNTYMRATFARYGLSTEYIKAWVLMARAPDGERAVRKLFTVNEAQAGKWTAMLQDVTRLTQLPCRSHEQQDCLRCSKPLLQACLDEDHIMNSLSSRGLPPDSRLDLLDGGSAALAAKHESSPPLMKDALFRLTQEVSSNMAPQRLPAVPHFIPVMTGREMIGSFTVFNGAQITQLGLSPGLITEAHTSESPEFVVAMNFGGQKCHLRGQVRRVDGHSVIYIQQQSSELVVTDTSSVVSSQNSTCTNMTPDHVPFLANRGNAILPLPALLPRVQADSRVVNAPAAPAKVQKPSKGHRNLSSRPLAHHKIPDSKWDQAAVQPTGVTKAVNGSCLTCIYMKRTCNGTKLINGKCQNCAPAPGKGHGGRKCYWKDPARGIRTYDDAKDADPRGRRIPQNTRLGRREREITDNFSVKAATRNHMRFITAADASSDEDKTQVASDYSSVGSADASEDRSEVANGVYAERKLINADERSTGNTNVSENHNEGASADIEMGDKGSEQKNIGKGLKLNLVQSPGKEDQIITVWRE